MAWIRTIPEERATDRLSELYADHVDPQTGVVDNILKIHSISPACLEAHLAVYTTAMRGTKTFGRSDREMIAVVVSRLNGCQY